MTVDIDIDAELARALHRASLRPKARVSSRPPTASRCDSDGAVAAIHKIPSPPSEYRGHRRTRSGQTQTVASAREPPLHHSPRTSMSSPPPTRGSSPRTSSSPIKGVGGVGYHPPGGTAASSFVVDATHDDEALARRLDQELRDAEYATALTLAERRHRSHHRVESLGLVGAAIPAAAAGGEVGTVAAVSSRRQDDFDFLVPPPPELTTTTTPAITPGGRGRVIKSRGPPDDCRGRFIYYGVRVTLVIVVIGITFVVWISLFGRSVSDDLDPASWLPGVPEGDPNLGSVGESNRWVPSSSGGGVGGLTLPILNNLVDGSDWVDYLEGSVSDWDSGTPDAVTLRILSSTYDPDCRAVRTAMKVCNGDYGPTDWRGVNQVLLQDDYIITSLAKMNDYYLEGTNAAQKRYTMCHELGHGLGLGHSDENFNNEDLGDCMDYTNMPQNNMHPGERNFLILEEMYGNVNSGESSVSMEQMLSDASQGGRRAAASDDDEFEAFAAYLSEPITTSSNFVAAAGGESDRLRRREDGSVAGGSWRLLSKTEKAEHHERILGNGYSIRTSILLVDDDEDDDYRSHLSEDEGGDDDDDDDFVDIDPESDDEGRSSFLKNKTPRNYLSGGPQKTDMTGMTEEQARG
ncbi:hypothetical protein ACHAXA_001479 [Cyclostephanos tholiformis]|uniref:Uncharacterized protein n=1 Tax=Cyclostephanos tholiformis TaxID=382380 RepID=A0ABD3RZ48_9STRA